MAELVEREEPEAVHLRRLAHEVVGSAREQRARRRRRAPAPRACRFLAGARAEAGPPEEALGLCGAEGAGVDGGRRHLPSVIGSVGAHEAHPLNGVPHGRPQYPALREGDPPRRQRARASGRRHRPRRGARDRAEARRAGRARQGRRGAAGPAPAASRRRAPADPDDARQRRPGRARRAPPLGRAPARRGRAAALPGRQGRDRPADRERLLLRLRVPVADQRRRPRERSRRRSSASSPRAAPGARGDLRRRRARAVRRPRASRTRSSSSTPPTAPISLYTQGDFTDLCRGPHLQTSAPIKAFKLTSLAGAYWRGDEHNTQLTRIYGTAFYSQKDLDEYLERLEQARARDHRRLGQQLDLFHFDEHSPGSPFWHPKGMAIFNTLEDLRRRENARRGYSEVKTPLIYDKALWVTSGHWEKFRENMFLIPIDERAHVRDQADELPRAHAPLRQRRCGATASSRSATRRRRRCTGTSSPARCTGSRASAT